MSRLEIRSSSRVERRCWRMLSNLVVRHLTWLLTNTVTIRSIISPVASHVVEVEIWK